MADGVEIDLNGGFGMLYWTIGPRTKALIACPVLQKEEERASGEHTRNNQHTQGMCFGIRKCDG
jgi:hypothetical protein